MLRAADTIWKTDTGRQRRDNEDNAYVRAPVFVVADGMGGAQAGEVASKLAVDEFHEELPSDGTAEERLAGRIQAANRRIYDLSHSDHELAGMGTTLTAAYLNDLDLAIAHVGDSRAYIFRDRELTRLTQDHSLVGFLIREGKLTEEQAAEHPQRSIITRALGIEADVEVDTYTISVRAGDVVLLCSDGLTSMIDEERIASILAAHSDLDQAGEQLIGAANDAGGRDNITVVLFRLEEVDGTGNQYADEPTIVGMERTPRGDDPPGTEPGARRGPEARRATGATLTAPAPAPAPGRQQSRGTPPLAHTQGRAAAPPQRRFGRGAKVFAALLSVLVVLFLVGGGAYLASRELFFVGTNAQGVVTIYRGLPYNGPLGLRLYEQFYVSGVPLSAVPADRRSRLVSHDLRSQSDAINLVRAAELGQLNR
jgi:serine/threonine protein phosphatase PrpC